MKKRKLDNNIEVELVTEEDVLKIIKKYKLDLNNLKSKVSQNLKAILENFKKLLENLVKDKLLESYEAFGGYRYDYILKNNINVDFLLKLHQKSDFNQVLDFFKTRFKDHCVNLIQCVENDLGIKLLVTRVVNINNNLFNNVITLLFYDTKSRKTLYRIKLFFTPVKFGKSRKVNVNEFILEKFDQVHQEYPNISNAIVLFKLLFFNQLTPCTDALGSAQDYLCNNDINGYVVNLILTHLCTINNYSKNIKTILLFNNLLNFFNNHDSINLFYLSNVENNMVNSSVTVKQFQTGPDEKETIIDIQEEDSRRYYLEGVNKYSKGLVMRIEKYNELNLLSHIEPSYHRLKYFVSLTLNILNSPVLSKDQKLNKLFLRRPLLCNFYDHFISFKCNSNQILDFTNQLRFLLSYCLKYSLKLLHCFILNPTTCITDKNEEIDATDGLSVLYFVVDENGEMNSRIELTEEVGKLSFFQHFFQNNYKLVKSNNILSYMTLFETVVESSGTKEEKLFSNRNNIVRELLDFLIKKLKIKVNLGINRLNIKYPLITETQKNLIVNTNNLVDIIMSLDLPINILNIYPLSDSYSYLNLYDMPDNDQFDTNALDNSIILMIKWGNDPNLRNPKTASYINTALLIYLINLLRRHYQIHYHILEVGKPTINNSVNNSVTTKYSNRPEDLEYYIEYGGYVYKLIIYREDSELYEEYVLNERCKSILVRDKSFINCIKLAKIFFTKYLKIDNNSLIKRLVLEHYEENESVSSFTAFKQIIWNIDRDKYNISNQNIGQCKLLLNHLNKQLLPRPENPETSLDKNVNSIENQLENQKFDVSIKVKSGENVKQSINYVRSLDIFDVYYYKYEVLNRFPKKFLKIYLNLKIKKFVPKLYIKQSNFTQQMVVCAKHIRDGDNMLVESQTSENPPAFFIIPNIILLVKLLSHCFNSFNINFLIH
ncbi:uncharacterized protein TA02930 [Theileria annulata]|uniref:Uncharacterized protein n=1 Tax=Theileria annulata TaxID=5874 RepID=Q4UHI8_THEAN|nr:uncharacterized protein TA02930 [Theileria annulata]CAI73451.1 hypothetical protein TA02930 [Theileria annulata]|eukprot:XP_954128.1 hypothetical protein TA02930 [Theileria annulata]